MSRIIIFFLFCIILSQSFSKKNDSEVKLKEDIDKTLQQYMQLPVKVEKSIGQNGVATNSQNSQNQESRWSPNHSKHEMPVSATDGINKSAKSLFSEGVWQRARRYGCKKLQYLYRKCKNDSYYSDFCLVGK